MLLPKALARVKVRENNNTGDALPSYNGEDLELPQYNESGTLFSNYQPDQKRPPPAAIAQPVAPAAQASSSAPRPSPRGPRPRPIPNRQEANREGRVQRLCRRPCGLITFSSIVLLVAVVFFLLLAMWLLSIASDDENEDEEYHGGGLFGKRVILGTATGVVVKQTTRMVAKRFVG